MRHFTWQPWGAALLALFLWTPAHAAPAAPAAPAPAAAAAPKVVVSIPALHSLVAGLTKGGYEPTLLFRDEAEVGAELTAAQVKLIREADLVVWAGAGLEKGLARSLAALPDRANHHIALSRHVPLLSLPGSSDHAADPRFWHDPKLAVMAVRRLAPVIALLDPDHSERYLDNEIELVARLRELGHRLHARFQGAPAGSVVSGGAPRYLAYRLGVERQGLPAEEAFVKVSGGAACTAIERHQPRPAAQQSAALESLGYGLAGSSDLYFRMMQGNADALHDCLAPTRLSARAQAEKAI